jgi:putative phosphotransacetylase
MNNDVVNYDELVKIITSIVTEKVYSSSDSTGAHEPVVPVGVSARHVHLSREHLDILFGSGYELSKKKELMGGQYAAEECVTIVGAKLSAIEKVRILGPLRGKTQVEVSSTDAVKIGVKAPVSESGKTEGSAAVTIVGPKGALYVNECCIVAKRHIHMSPSDAEAFGVKDNDVVSVEAEGPRGGIMKNVQIRVDKSYTLEMHIDTDEANALGIKCSEKLRITK